MRRRGVRFALVAIAVVAAVVGGYVWHRLATGGEVTAVPVDEAVDRFRASATSTTVSATTAPPSTVPLPSLPPVSTSVPSTVAPASTPVDLPDPGVYVYATTGFDSVDVLTGARHDYPAVTTVTVTASDCGVRLRWAVADERWDEWEWCAVPGGVAVRGWSGFHEFFDIGVRSDYACEGEPRPLDAAPGTTWSMVCRIEDRDTSTFRGTVVERTTVAVGGVEVPALHVRYEVHVQGASVGTQRIDGWYRTTDSLLLREELSTDTVQETAVGRTTFQERATIELTSLTPVT